MNSDITTTTIDRRGKFFRLISGTIIEWSTMLDFNSEITENPDACILAIYELPNGRFKGVDLRLFGAKAMLGIEVECTGINRRAKFFRLIDDTVLSFARMLDINLNPTDDADDCAVAIVKLPDGLLRCVDLRIFDDHPDMWEVTQ